MTERSLVHNTADEEQVRAARQKESRGRALEIEDMRAVLDTPQGRRFCWRILSLCGAFQSVFDESPARLAFKAGKQDLGLKVLSELEAATPEALALMRTEAHKLEKRNG